MTIIDYKVLLNRQTDEDGRLAIFTRFRSEDSYQPGDELEEVFVGQLYAEASEHLLDVLFEKFNRGAPGFIGDDLYPQRSLSKGDVVEISDGLQTKRFACQSIGWKEVA